MGSTEPSGAEPVRERPPKEQVLWVNLALAVASILLVLIVIEGGARLLIWARYGDPMRGTDAGLQYEPYLTFSRTDVMHRSYPSRGPDHLRVLLLGGSTARQMPDSVLAGALRKSLSRPVQVINMGHDSYIVNQELVTLALYGIPLEPDVIVTLDGANDLGMVTKTGEPGIHNHVALIRTAVDRPVWNGVLGILRHSQFMNAVNMLRERRVERDRQSDPALLEATYRHYLDRLDAISVIADGLEAVHVAVLQPYLHLRAGPDPAETGVAANYAYRKEFMTRAIEELSTRMERYEFAGPTLFVDGTTVCDDTEVQCFQDEVHLMPAGNELLAKHVAERLAHHGLPWPIR